MSNLVLTRRVGEKVVIYDTLNGPKIVITILGYHNARLSIEAPEAVHVDREEIYQRKRANTVGRKKIAVPG